MEFNNSFTVAKPIDEVWSTMTDLERVIPAVPGAEILEKTGDDAVKAAVKIRLGSMSMNYSGPAEIVEKDDAAHRALMTAQAKELTEHAQKIATEAAEPIKDSFTSFGKAA